MSAFVSIAVCFVCYIGIYNWKGNSVVSALTHKSCTKDEILRATFEEMLAYLENTRAQNNGGTLQILLFVILLCNVGALIYKKKVLDKTCQDSRSKELESPLI